MGYINIPELVKSCNSVASVEETNYEGKSGQETIYKVTLDTNPAEFVAEFAYGVGEFDQLGILIGKPGDDLNTVYVLRIVSDMFWYLIKEDYLGSDDMPFTLEPKVRRVINYLKTKSKAFNWNFYFNDLDVNEFDDILKTLEEHDA